MISNLLRKYQTFLSPCSTSWRQNRWHR